ncbi:MAG: DUF285 domain-containing protein [Proteobacteria bacterium]|nr:DUF285 domain-containing protein [Pseudomonadota bacterium]
MSKGKQEIAIIKFGKSTLNSSDSKISSTLIEVRAFGPVGLGKMAFKDYTELTNLSKVDIPNSIEISPSLNYYFANAKAFNHPIENWDTSNVTNMSYMFLNATSFDQPIGAWDTSNVTDMSYMFHSDKEKTSFNQPIGTWNTSNVKNMNHMFYNASSFNQPIGTWNTSNVSDMSYMFVSAIKFDQDISSWNVQKYTKLLSMFDKSGLSNDNYCKIVNSKSWVAKPNIIGFDCKNIFDRI